MTNRISVVKKQRYKVPKFEQIDIVLRYTILNQILSNSGNNGAMALLCVEFEQTAISYDPQLTTLNRIQVNRHCYSNPCYPKKIQSQGHETCLWQLKS